MQQHNNKISDWSKMSANAVFNLSITKMGETGKDGGGGAISIRFQNLHINQCKNGNNISKTRGP